MGPTAEEIDLVCEQRQLFLKHVLRDLRALERMIDEGRFEQGIRRIGAEQEIVFIDGKMRPAPVGLQVLERLRDNRFTTELALFNIEFNVPPVRLGGDCLTLLESRLASGLELVRAAAAEIGACPVLVGILPTLEKSDLHRANITPEPRYLSLVNTLRKMRGAPYEFRFTGVDELVMQHESVFLEACNTSSQFHLQVTPAEFPRFFNVAQVVTAPVLAASVNSPLLFGRRLWRETRIALFQQAVDTRRPMLNLEHRSARVRFGEDWVRESVLEIFRNDVSRFRVVFDERCDEDPMEMLDRGSVPRLRALQLHTGTVYRWNRACYGITDGKPHLRIENRVLPAGPTVVDEVANAAFWYGLMLGVPAVYGDVSRSMRFEEAKRNFLLVAHVGLDARLQWIDEPRMDAAELIRRVLLPISREGLLAANVDSTDVDHYLGIIEERVTTRQTGSQWQLDSLKSLQRSGTRRQALDELVMNTCRLQATGRPVHEWPIVKGDDMMPAERFERVSQFMTTDVFVVHEDDVIDLAASVMDWRHVRHVPVEDDRHRLVGLISYRQLLRFLAQDLPHGKAHPVAARQVMQPDPVTVRPDTPTLEAIEVMRREKVPCLPVVQEEHLVGIVTERDFIPIAARLLEDRLRACE